VLKMQNFVVQCKAHGAQNPRQYAVLRRGGEHRVTLQCAQKMNFEDCDSVG
jgi:hypothetical protein